MLCMSHQRGMLPTKHPPLRLPSHVFDKGEDSCFPSFSVRSSLASMLGLIFLNRKSSSLLPVLGSSGEQEFDLLILIPLAVNGFTYRKRIKVSASKESSHRDTKCVRNTLLVSSRPLAYGRACAFATYLGSSFPTLI
jgi:hypothetical protein